MDISTLITVGLAALGVGYLIARRDGETANQSVPIPIPVTDRRR